ncbi:biotin synthase BioB [Acetonema longum]|uniref:Biotin synthase n=1 Tax=Acetonema longum DSM 6540 TaxID=1009370 RepID=F7NGP4_9FIRM|nr:biotin synthase BioB [Acetonema longum]EGO64848.1 biotin synthase [Acetonema longum DSM 6540]
MSYDLIFNVGKKVLNGGQISFDEALALTEIEESDIPILLGVANKVRETFTGNAVDTCQIVNARSGNCSENCKFCAQSAHHEVKIEVYPLMSEDDIVSAAKQAEAQKAGRFCIVTAGCGMDGDPDFTKITAAIRRIGRETSLNRCCSLGTLDTHHVAALKEAGISRYHHNLEASESYFESICTTHTYRERVETIKKVKAAGLQICSGGIIGMGETFRQRVELAFALKELDADSIPINVLNPVKGTPLENQTPLKPLAILQTFAIFRLILPSKIIRYAGGREHNLGELVPLGFLSGINGMLMGHYLTTQGRGADRDLDTLQNLGLQPICNQAG